MNFGKNPQHDFPKMRGGGQRPFGTFPKIHPFLKGQASLSLRACSSQILAINNGCALTLAGSPSTVCNFFAGGMLEKAFNILSCTMLICGKRDLTTIILKHF